MKDKVWETQYEGKTLRVTNRVSFFPPRTSEHLQVDGETVNENRGGFLRMNSTLRTQLDLGGSTKQIEVRIAQKEGSLQTGCHILVDGVIVGGDIDNKLKYPDPGVAKALYAQGPARFIIMTGFLRYGLPFAITMAFLGTPAGLLATVVTFAAQLVFFGGAMGWFMWRSLEAQVGRTQA